MSEYLIAFNFSATTPEGISAQLNITDSNAFLFDKGIQLQPFWAQIPLPPLNFASVNGKSLSISTHDGGSTGQQGIRITLAVSANGPVLSGNIPYAGGPEVSVSYQFLGYSDQGLLAAGNFSIPFPS
jgi:hypothetical protein